MPISWNPKELLSVSAGALATALLIKFGISPELASFAGTTVTGVIKGYSFKQKQIKPSLRLTETLHETVSAKLNNIYLPKEARNAVLELFLETDAAGILRNDDTVGRLGLQMRELFAQCNDCDIDTMPFKAECLARDITESLENSIQGNHELTTLVTYFNTKDIKIVADEIKINTEDIKTGMEKIQHSYAAWYEVEKSVQGKRGRWLIPYNLNFVGREGKLEEIENKFINNSAVSITQTIHGLGGIGKSQLALRYAYAFAAKNPQAAVWWFAAENADTLEIEVGRFLSSIGVNQNRSSNETVSETLQLWAINNNDNWLFVFDNVEKYEDVKKFIISGPMQGHILLTTRNREGFPELVDLSVYSDLEAITYLQKRLDPKKYDEMAARLLINRLGNFPLALSQAAAYISHMKWNISQYLDKIAKYGPDKTLPVNKEPDYNKIIWETWSITFAQLNGDAKRLLNILSYFSADNLPVRDYNSTPLKHLFPDEDVFDDAVHQLRNFAMIDENDGIHRLLQEVVRHEDVNKPAHAEAMGCLVDALYKAYEQEIQDKDKYSGENAFADLAAHVISACSYVDSEVEWTLEFDKLREQKDLSSNEERFKWLLLITSALLEKMLDIQRGAYTKLMGEKMLLKPDGTVWLFGGFEWEVLRERIYKGKRQALIITRKVIEQRAYDQVTYEEWKSDAYMWSR